MPEIKIDKIIRSRRKSIALVVMQDASLVIRAPLGVSNDYIQSFIRQKSKWIIKKQRFFLEAAQKNKPKEYVNGEVFYFMGNQYKLKIIPGVKPAIWLDENLNISETCLTNPAKHLSGWYIEQAKSIIAERVKLFSRLFDNNFKSVRINSAKSRWGSCGPANTLNFSWRLVMAPMPIIDYVVAHELVHTGIKNHSTKFYKKLETVMPDYKEREKWFKTNHGFTII
jgi:predicted metal-dependent hydrolase